jgi:hypothetical protein
MWLRVHAFAVVALAAGSFFALLLSMLFLVFSTIIATIEKSVQNNIDTSINIVMIDINIASDVIPSVGLYR